MGEGEVYGQVLYCDQNAQHRTGDQAHTTRQSNGDTTKRTPTGINTNRNIHSFHFRLRLELAHLAHNHPVVAYTPTVTSPISADSSNHAATTTHLPPPPRRFLLRKACSRKNIEKKSQHAT